MIEHDYRPCLLVRLVAPRLPRPWQEFMVNDQVGFLVGWGLALEIKRVFNAASLFVVLMFALALVGLCWGVPAATPVILLIGLVFAWWGYGLLGLYSPTYSHREWVKSQVDPSGSGPIDDHLLGRMETRWKVDLLLVYGRPQSASELQLVWLRKDTIQVPTQAQVRPRL